MDPNNYIVCYTGGTCGDLITALIDSTDAQIKNGAVIHLAGRSRLKKFHLFNSTEEKNSYLTDIFQQYNSIPSHDLDYHVRQQHNFVSIVVNSFKTAQWAAKRFKSLHRPHVWEEMAKTCGAESVDDYGQLLLHYSAMVKKLTAHTLSLEKILNGYIVDDLENIIGQQLSNDSKLFYQLWLTHNETSKNCTW